jgi:hypothetical protein
MTKSELREVSMVHTYIQHGMTDTAARALSGLIRCARTTKSQTQLRELAEILKLTNHPDFIC